MGAIGGLFGGIATGDLGGGNEAALKTISKWSVNETASPPKAHATGAGQMMGSIPGNFDWSGSYTSYSSVLAALPGDTVGFVGAGIQAGATSKGVAGDIIVDSMAIDIDLEGKKPIVQTVGFSGNGELTHGTVNCPEDTTVPTYAPSGVCKVEIALGAAYTAFAAIANQKSIKLTLSRANVGPSYDSNSGSWPRRVPGPIDAALEVGLYALDTDVWASLPAPNTIAAVRVYTTAALFFLIKWMIFNSRGGLDVDIESGAFVGASLGAQLNGATDVSGVQTRGTILLPGGAIWAP